MPLLKIEHPELGPQQTRLSADVSASASSSTVDNNQGFATNDYTLFGKINQEKTEIVKLTGTTGNTTISHSTGPVFDHPARTPIILIRYNQVQIHRATSETGSYSLVTTIDITPDEPYTYYDDTAGTSSSWYKVKYYNETTAVVSAFSDAVQGSGYSTDSLRAMTDEVLSDFGDPLATELSRDQVRRWLRAGVRKLSTKLVTTFPEYRKQYATQALTSGTATYDLPSRFLSFLRVDVNYTGSSATAARKAEVFESEREGYPDTAYQTSDPRVYFRGDQFVLKPTPTSSSGYAFLWYWDYPAEMTDEADTHGLPYGANEYLIAYALYRAWMSKNKDAADEYKAELKDLYEEYTTFISTGRQKYRNSRSSIEFGHDLYETGV